MIKFSTGVALLGNIFQNQNTLDSYVFQLLLKVGNRVKHI